MSITPTGGAEAEPPSDVAHGHARGPLYKLAIGAVGIVFGDIGTSPIYAFRETFAGHHQLIPDRLHVYGVLSLIFWSMMIIVTLKYVTIIMRADNKGEGGSLALLALINRTLGASKRWTTGIILLGVFATEARGTAKVGLLFGPVMIFYFVTIAVLGAMHVVDQPSVILAMLNPINALLFFTTDFMRAFIALGSVGLALTS